MRHSLRQWMGLCCAACAMALCAAAFAEEPAGSTAPGFSVPAMQPSFSTPEVQAPNVADVPNAAPSVPWLQHITDAAKAYGVDAHLLQAVMKVESNFDPYVVSRSGAVGLMQIMPLTAMSALGLQGTPQSLKQQLLDPAINVHAGAMYLRSLMDTFAHRLDLALAAYNAGTGNVRKAGNRVPPNGETPKFVAKVLSNYDSIKSNAASIEAPQPVAPAANASVPLVK